MVLVATFELFEAYSCLEVLHADKARIIICATLVPELATNGGDLAATVSTIYVAGIVLHR